MYSRCPALHSPPHHPPMDLMVLMDSVWRFCDTSSKVLMIVLDPRWPQKQSQELELLLMVQKSCYPVGVGSLSPLFHGSYTSQVVQDIIHQQYVRWKFLKVPVIFRLKITWLYLRFASILRDAETTLGAPCFFKCFEFLVGWLWIYMGGS